VCVSVSECASVYVNLNCTVHECAVSVCDVRTVYMCVYVYVCVDMRACVHRYVLVYMHVDVYVLCS